jgi:hypothetical protein
MEEMGEGMIIQMMMEKEDVGGIEITTATINPETIAIAKTSEIALETNIAIRETANEMPPAIATTRNPHYTEEIARSPKLGIEITKEETEIEITIENPEIKTTTAKTEIEKTLGEEIDMKIVISLLVEGIEMGMVIIGLRVDRFGHQYSLGCCICKYHFLPMAKVFRELCYRNA